MKLKIHVSPGKKEFKIKGIREFSDALNVDVSAPAQDGKANEELVEKLAEFFQSAVKIVSGNTSRDKFIELDLNKAEFKAKLKKINQDDCL